MYTVDDPVCGVCGGDTTLDTRQGHVVCLDCGTVLQEWTTGEDRFEAMSRVTSADVPEVKRRKIDRFGGMKAKVTALIDHHRLGSATTTACAHMLDLIPPGTLRDRDLDAWAVISLACEYCKSCRSIADLATLAGTPSKKLITTRDSLRPYLKSLFSECTVPDAVDDTLTAMNTVLTSIYTASDAGKKLAARRHVMRRANDNIANAAFMNLRPMTRAMILVSEHLKSIGFEIGPAERAALKLGSSGVRNGLKKLLPTVPPTA